jgi:hypothetical protein
MHSIIVAGFLFWSAATIGPWVTAGWLVLLLIVLAIIGD